MKDLFSGDSASYFHYRPSYPKSLFDYLQSLQPKRENAWDCGTGNGQVAVELAGSWANIFAKDISQNQIDQAPAIPNVHFSVQAAENTNFTDRSLT